MCMREWIDFNFLNSTTTYTTYQLFTIVVKQCGTNNIRI